MGRHALGPQVVGLRVVVRHLLPDGRATDVLGVCTSWGETELVVDRDGDGPVTIRLADVVTGKPVPPRPSVRARVSVRDAEGHGLLLWPTMERADVGEWVLRHAPAAPPARAKKRANSALVAGDVGIPLSDATNEVLKFYTERNQVPMVQVESGSSYDRWFTSLGWQHVPGGDSHFQIASVSRALRSCNALLSALPRRSNDASEHVTARYMEEPGQRLQVALEAYADSPAAEGPVSDGSLAEGLLADGSLADGPAADRRVVASGEAALDGDWLGLHSLAVEPSHRRRGLGTQVVADLLDWGASLGATTAWLHVETDNEAGLATYERLGFVTHHTSRYLSG